MWVGEQWDWLGEELGAGGRKRQGVHVRGTDKTEDTGPGGGGEIKTSTRCSLICKIAS